MKTHAYFENIQSEIIEVLQSAQYQIRIAVAWFTDSQLFDILLSKAKKGVKIELLLANNFINHESSINYGQLNQFGGSVTFIGNDSEKAPLMHNKFLSLMMKSWFLALIIGLVRHSLTTKVLRL